jgi:hypothetical protein
LDRGTAHRKVAIYTQSNTNRINANKTSMPQLGFEHMISVLERAKKVHALEIDYDYMGNSPKNSPYSPNVFYLSASFRAEIYIVGIPTGWTTEGSEFESR